MKLYSFPIAASARRARIALAEKGLDATIEDVDLRSGRHLEPAYLAINPQGLVPVLELDDGTRQSHADITAVVFIDMLRMAKVELPTTLQPLCSWYDRVRARASYAA